MSPKVRDGENIGTHRKVIKMNDAVAITCDAQSYPHPDFRLKLSLSGIGIWN